MVGPLQMDRSALSELAGHLTSLIGDFAGVGHGNETLPKWFHGSEGQRKGAVNLNLKLICVYLVERKPSQPLWIISASAYFEKHNQTTNKTSKVLICQNKYFFSLKEHNQTDSISTNISTLPKQLFLQKKEQILWFQCYTVHVCSCGLHCNGDS